MENFTLQVLATELAPLLTGQRIGRIYQLGTTDLAVDLRLRDGRLLMISTDPKRLAMYLTARNVRQLAPEARIDTAFVALAKKYLGGARITSVEGIGFDRVVRIGLVMEDETGETPRELVIQLTGRSANVFILENNLILAVLRERAPDAETIYQEPLPPAAKLDPFDCSTSQLGALLEANEHDLIAVAQNHLIGFGLQYATELAVRAKHLPLDRLLPTMLDELFAQAPNPAAYSSAPMEAMRQNPGGDTFTLAFAPIVMEHLQYLHRTPFATLNQAADAYYTLLDERRHFLALRQQLESHLNTRLKKAQALLKNLIREQEGFSKGETHQRYGELLLANLHQTVLSEGQFRVVDFYDPEQQHIAIPAASKGTAQEAAEHYFKLARKARNGLQTITARLPLIEAEIANLKLEIERLSTVSRLAALEEKQAQLGIARPKQPSAKATIPHRKPKEGKISGVRRYRSSDGFEILVGRTSRDNDHLTLRVAKSVDLWFHAADYPGSHVVLRNPKRSVVPNRAILEAAQLAAKFSQANNESGAKVAVNYCEKKFVTKPKGFGVGQVRLSSFKTILVEPAEAGERLL